MSLVDIGGLDGTARALLSAAITILCGLRKLPWIGGAFLLGAVAAKKNALDDKMKITYPPELDNPDLESKLITKEKQ